MKATGIVRRIDDLGRVVVPKEIRRTLRIREAHRRACRICQRICGGGCAGGEMHRVCGR